MWISSDIFFELISSTLLSYLYGFIQHALYLIFVGSHCKFTVPLVKNFDITNGPIYGVSYFYAVCFVSTALSPTL